MDENSSHHFLFQAIIPLSLFCFIITKLWLHKSSKKKNLPPSPLKVPILGNLHQLSSLPHKDLQTLAKKHGPIMLLHYGSMPTLIVSSSDGAREIMKTHDLTFADRPDIGVSRRLLYDCKDVSVSPYGEYWRQLKSICVLQLLSNKRVQSFDFIRKQETELLMKKIEKSCCFHVNLSEIFTEFTNDVICRSAFGRKYSEGENGKRFLSLLREFLELLGTISVGDFVPGLSWINWVNGFDARVDKVAKELDEFLEGVIKERMVIFDQEEVKCSNGENFVDILLDIYLNNSSGVSFDRDSIKAIILRPAHRPTIAFLVSEFEDKVHFISVEDAASKIKTPSPGAPGG
ncbi:cytochrome p450 71a8 [Phtheirospermum japonicum]|uniref:Cytochrome p450 71a8 n=1 Tax=Phtheirospermum japonicum TaxID=374723 RepID=A0A830BNI2_9LAMI|nr:cytochrome p450 71a8 [Phtheirospermum japonicum]